MKKGLIISIVSVAVALAAIGYVLQSNKNENQAKTDIVAKAVGKPLVSIEKVKLSDIEMSFTANGIFGANQDLSLVTEYAGKVVSITVDEGSKVSKGQVLAKFDTELAQAEYNTAKANLERLKQDRERYKNTMQSGGISQQQLDEINLNVVRAESAFIAAKRKLDESTIKSPINGTIHQRYIEQGSFLGVGAKVFDIVDVSSLNLKVNANESQVVLIKTGDPVEVKSPVFPGKTAKGKVKFIAPKADAALNFGVEILVDNTGSELRAGMYGTASFRFPKQAQTILIPRSTFIESVSSNKIYVLEDGKAVQRDVIAGRIIGERVEVLQGVKPGESVIINGQINLTDGIEVQVQ